MADIERQVAAAIDPDEVGRRRQLQRDLWAGKRLDHVPFFLTVSEPAPRYTTRELLQDGEKQRRNAFAAALLSYRSVPGGDWVPAVRPDVGCSCLATAFGAELYWGENPEQTCGVREPVITDLSSIDRLEVPPADAGVLGDGTRRVRRFAETGRGLVAVSLLDMAGGPNVALDLLGAERLYTAMVEEGEALELLLDRIQSLFLSAIKVQITAAGGEDFIATTDFPDTWFPEGRKGHLSDDVSANIAPALYRRFSIPFHDRVFRRYGGGGLHNCGPNPCLEEYLRHSPAPRSVDLSHRFSAGDLPRIKRVFRRRAFVYLGDFNVPARDLPGLYRGLARAMAPEVIVVAQFGVTTRDDPRELHRRLLEVSREYAAAVDWGWED